MFAGRILQLLVGEHRQRAGKHLVQEKEQMREEKKQKYVKSKKYVKNENL